MSLIDASESNKQQQTLVDRMKDAGFVPITVDKFSDDFFMWQDLKTGKQFGLDGWDCVQWYLDNLKVVSEFQETFIEKDEIEM